MDSVPVRRPRVSRETRLLLTTAFLAVLALWLLARFRFPDAATSQATVPPILAPLVPRQGFTDLADQLADITSRTSPTLLSLKVIGTGRGVRPEGFVAAIRLREDVAAGLLEPGDSLAPETLLPVLAHDTVTGLTLFRVPQGVSAVANTAWPPRDPSLPRYLMRSDAFADRVSLLPVVTSGLQAVDAPLWSDAIWELRSGVELAPGAFVFSAEGDWIGLAARHREGPALVPAGVVTRHAERLLARMDQAGATLGIELQALTPAISRLTAATRGVVVSYVDGRGPAADSVQVGDVAHAADGRSLPTLEHWQRYLADLRIGATTTLTVRRAGVDLEVPLAAVAEEPSDAEEPPARRALGTTTRLSRGAGAEITGIEPGSMASAAGLRVGDIITKIGNVSKPTPGQVRQVVAESSGGGPILVAIDRGGQHHVTALEP